MRIFALLSASLLLAACGSAPRTDASREVHLADAVDRVHGAAVVFDLETAHGAPWPHGAGTVETRAPGTQQRALATATLAADGTFTLDLPTEVPEDLLHAFTPVPAGNGCTGQVTVDPPDLRTLPIESLHARTETRSTLLADFELTRFSDTTLEWRSTTLVYADRDALISGSTTCEVNTGNSTVRRTSDHDVQVRRGWNILSRHVAYSNAEGTTYVTRTTSADHTNREWYDFGGAVGAAAFTSPAAR